MLVELVPGGRARRPAGDPAGPRDSNDTAITVGAYAMLFVLGVGEGVIGSFFYAAGPAPAAAIGFAAGIFVICLLGAFGMLAAGGALAPALGWFAAAFALATVTGSGSVIITDTGAGKWFLFGGAACAVAATVAAFAGFSRPRPRPRPGRRAPRR